MDPNATLTELRALVGARMAERGAAQTLLRIAELVQALDTHITRGGFLPDPWRVAKRPDTELARAVAAHDEYNGHTNRETWAAELHLGNEGIYQAARMAIRQKLCEALDAWTGDAGEFTLTAARNYAGEGCKDYVDALKEENWEGDARSRVDHRDVAMMLSDIGSLWRVDWRSVSESLIDDDELGTLVTELRDAQ